MGVVQQIFNLQLIFIISFATLFIYMAKHLHHIPTAPQQSLLLNDPDTWCDPLAFCIYTYLAPATIAEFLSNTLKYLFHETLYQFILIAINIFTLELLV
jgi:hypothetical protein